MDAIAKYQRQLLDQALQLHHRTPISEATVRAYLATPRHLFVRRYREPANKDWCEINAENLHQHLAVLYEDRPLALYGDDDSDVPSTISQPSFVLRMLDLLRVEPGHIVFELGAGSGWNAALIAALVGPRGSVYSTEIIPEMARRAAGTIEELGIENVHIVEADGGDAYAAGAPYDRMTFTAGTYDLPRQFYEQLKPGGLLLAVIKNEGGGDNLFLLRKADDHLESVYSVPCGFVQMTGKHKQSRLDPIALESLAEWPQLQTREIARRPFWWGTKGGGGIWSTLGIRSFLGITEPLFRSFKIESGKAGIPEQMFFGLWDPDGGSLVVAKDDELISYGSLSATDRLLRKLHEWIDLGMPTAASFDLKVYRHDRLLAPSDKQWVVRRDESQFLWSLPHR